MSALGERLEEALLAEDDRLDVRQARHLARVLTAHRAELPQSPNRARVLTAPVDAPVLIEDPAARAARDALLADLDPHAVMRRVLEQVVALLPNADGAMLDLPAPGHTRLTCAAAAGSLRGCAGLEQPVESTLAGAVHRAGTALASADAVVDVRADLVRARASAGALLAVPLRRPPSFSAVLTVASTQPRALTEADEAALEGVARVAAVAIANATDLALEARVALDGDPAALALVAAAATWGDSAGSQVTEVSDRIRRVIDAGVLRVAYQPIVALHGGAVVGYEALSRFPVHPRRPPDEWFAEAAMVGLGTDLELQAVTAALRTIDRLAAPTYLSVNVSPTTAASHAFAALCASAPVEKMVVEVTEHAPVGDYDTLKAALARVRARGARVAIDDAGAGFASLRHILRLSPDIIKLDATLVRRIDTDPVRQAMAAALISFAAEAQATIVAEGVESQWELDVLRGLGVEYGQGFFLARPGPLP